MSISLAAHDLVRSVTAGASLNALALLLFALYAVAPAHAARAPDHDRVIDVERVIDAPVADVWKAWTTSEGLESFMAPQARVELRVGGAFEPSFDPAASKGLRGAEGCRVLSYLPEKMLSFSWNAPPQFPDVRRKRTHVVLTFEPAGDERTRLALRHLGWPAAAGENATDLGRAWDQVFAYFSSAWPAVLDACARRFEDGPRDFGDLASAAPQARVAHDRPGSHSVSRILPARPEVVWAWLTEEDKVAHWMAAKAEVDLRIGGEYRNSYDPNSSLEDDATIVNRILAYEPNRMIAIRNVRAPASFPFDNFQDTWSVMSLEPTPDGRTRLVIAAHGYGEGGEWDDLRAFFDRGNAQLLETLAQRLAGDQEAPEPTTDPDAVMKTLARLVGGEWIHESKADGTTFRVRNVFRFGPDGRSVVSDGWLGGGAGMLYHSHAVARHEPLTGEVRLLDVSETGALAHATIALEGPGRLAYDWRAVQPDASVQRYDIDIVFTGPDTYEMTLARVDDDGQRQTMLDGACFRRAEDTPGPTHRERRH